MRNNKKTLPILVLIIMCLSFSKVYAQLSEKYPNYEELSFEGMEYGLFKPKNYNPEIAYPVVLYFHGMMDTVSHDLDWYHEPFQTENPCFVLSPKSYGNPLEGKGWVNSTGELIDGEKAVEILNLTMGQYNIDKNRLYLHGVSLGAAGVDFVLATYPEKFAAANVICGVAPMAIASKVLNIPLWFFHGQMDDIIPVQLTRNIYNEIKKLGGTMVRYTEYPGVKHDSWIRASNEKTLKTWMFKQEKGKTAGDPGKPEGVTVEPDQWDNILSWNLPTNVSSDDNKIWYYQILRNDKVLAEVDGNVSMFTDNVLLDHDYYGYKIIAVNYFFKKSKPTETVRVKKSQGIIKSN